MTIDCTKQKPDINDLPKDIQRQLYTVIKFKWTLNNTKGLIMKTKILMLSFALSLGISTGASAISPCLAEFMACVERDAGANERVCEAEFKKCAGY